MAYGNKRKPKKTNKVKVTDLMTGFEVRTFFGYKRTAADEVKTEQALTNAVKKRLAKNVEVKTKEGEVVNVSGADLLVDAKFQHDLENPGEIDLTKWGKAAGEDTSTTNLNVVGADELFGDIVNKKK